MAVKHGLGRGLKALIKDDDTPAETGTSGVTEIPVGQIHANSLQPRRIFDETALSELTDSIRSRGVLQPLLLRNSPEGYELIAGERRLRAARQAELETVPAIVVNVPDSESLELALVENLQREDLGAIEEAEGYKMLADRFNLTQSEIASRVGKARATVTNAMRLLELPREVMNLLSSGRLSAGHAKILLGVQIPEERVLLAKRCVNEDLSVRTLEKLVRNAGKHPRKPRAAREDIPRDYLGHLSEKLHLHFGTSIRINPSRTYANGKKGRGCIEIDYYSGDDLNRILEIIGMTGE